MGSAALGAERIDVLAVIGGGGTGEAREIFLNQRLPRVLTGALVGAGGSSSPAASIR